MSRNITKHAFEPSVSRSRSERLLDRHYYHQSKKLKRTVVTSSSKHFNKSIVKDTKVESDASIVREKPSMRSPCEALEILTTKHLPNSSKFAKAIELLRKLIQTPCFQTKYKIPLLKALETVALQSGCTASSPSTRKEILGLFRDPLWDEQRRVPPYFSSWEQNLQIFFMLSKKSPDWSKKFLSSAHSPIEFLKQNICTFESLSDDSAQLNCWKNYIQIIEEAFYKFGCEELTSDDLVEMIRDPIVHLYQLYLKYTIQSNSSSNNNTEKTECITHEARPNASALKLCTSDSAEILGILAQSLSDEELEHVFSPPLYYTEAEVNFLQILKLRGILHNQVFTDDSYQFNTTLNEFKTFFEKWSQKTKMIANETHALKLHSEYLPLQACPNVGVSDNSVEFFNLDSDASKALHACSETVVSLSGTLDSSSDYKNSTSLKDQSDLNVSKQTVKKFTDDSSNPNDNACSMSSIIPSTSEQHEDVKDTWSAPQGKQLEELTKRFFVQALGDIFKMKHLRWAKPAIDALFQKVFFYKDIFEEAQQEMIASWQNQLKIPLKSGINISAQLITESPVPIQDGRDVKIIASAGSQIWSNKQFGL